MRGCGLQSPMCVCASVCMGGARQLVGGWGRKGWGWVLRGGSMRVLAGWGGDRGLTHEVHQRWRGSVVAQHGLLGGAEALCAVHHGQACTVQQHLEGAVVGDCGCLAARQGGRGRGRGRVYAQGHMVGGGWRWGAGGHAGVARWWRRLVGQAEGRARGARGGGCWKDGTLHECMHVWTCGQWHQLLRRAGGVLYPWGCAMARRAGVCPKPL